MITLRDYQIESLDAIDAALDRGIDKQLIVLPTGAGKTVVMSQVPARFPGRMLLLAHRSELLTQARAKIVQANPQLNVQIEQAGEWADEDADVVIASVATLGRKASARLARFRRDHFTTILIDEAHHAAASTYVRILDYFGNAPRLRLGVTATPQRGDNVSLTQVFDEVTYYKSMGDLIDAGYLVDLIGYRMTTGTDISSVTTRSGDYAVGELSEAINTPERNALAVTAYRSYLDGERAVVFCTDVAHANDMAETFAAAGIPTGMVVGTTLEEERKATFAALHTGELLVLTGVGVFTEGFDEPALKGVIMARPTKSNLLYTQCVGRAVRLWEGKDHAIIIDLADSTKGKKPVGLPTLMGLPPDFDTEGTPLTEAAEEYKKLEEQAPGEAVRATSMRELAAAWERIDLFRPPPPNPAILEYSSFVWMESSPEHYALNISATERLSIRATPLGSYEIAFTDTSRPIKTAVPMVTVPTMHQAFTVCDKWVMEKRADAVALLDANAAWRTGGPSEKQLKWLKKFGVPITETMTKGEASAILDQLFAANPKTQSSRPAWLERKIRERR